MENMDGKDATMLILVVVISPFVVVLLDVFMALRRACG